MKTILYLLAACIAALNVSAQETTSLIVQKDTASHWLLPEIIRTKFASTVWVPFAGIVSAEVAYTPKGKGEAEMESKYFDDKGKLAVTIRMVARNGVVNEFELKSYQGERVTIQAQKTRSSVSPHPLKIGPGKYLIDMSFASWDEEINRPYQWYEKFFLK